MFAPLSDGHFTYFPKPELDEVLATIDRREVDDDCRKGSAVKQRVGS